MAQQYMLEMAKIIHNCKHFPICYTIPMLSVIKLATIEGHRFLYTIIAACTTPPAAIKEASVLNYSYSYG